MEITADNHQESVQGSDNQTEGEKVPKDADVLEGADSDEVDNPEEEKAAQEEDDNVNQPIETNPTKWRDDYAEYKSWSRTLKIYGKVDLIFHNGLRRDMLKRLSQSEVTGMQC